MKIKMLATISGTRSDGGDWPARGAALETGKAEAAELIAAGLASEWSAVDVAPNEPEADANQPAGKSNEPEADADKPKPTRKPRKAPAKK